MYVLNIENGTRFELNEDTTNFTPLSDEQYKELEKNIPKQNEKFADPVIDRLAIWLYYDRYTLEHCFHYRKCFSCLTPVYVDNNKYYPMRWYFERILIKFRDTMLPEEHRNTFMNNWKQNLALALAKIEGKFYTSAGMN